MEKYVKKLSGTIIKGFADLLEKADKEGLVIPIAVTGGIRSGKSSVFEIIKSVTEEALGKDYVEDNESVVQLSFGKKLKEAFADIFEHSEATDTAKNVHGLQMMGQGCREIDNDVWVQHVSKEFESILKANEKAPKVTVVILDDLRQLNEFRWLKDNGFKIIRVHADEGIRYERAIACGDKVTMEDITESPLEKMLKNFEVDFEVVNESTPSNYVVDILTLFRDIIKEHLDEGGINDNDNDNDNEKHVIVSEEELRESMKRILRLYPDLKCSIQYNVDGDTELHSFVMALEKAYEDVLTDQEKDVLDLIYFKGFYQFELITKLEINRYQLTKIINGALLKLAKAILVDEGVVTIV